jgi:DnaJ family protein B protein 6
MFERDFSSSMGGGRFGEDPTFANHQRMADTNGFGFGTAFGSGAAFGFGGGMPLMGADIDDSPFASHGSNDMAATRRGAPGFGNDGMMGTMSSAFGSFSSSSMSNSTMGGKFSSQSESRNTRTVNGRTETVIRKVDGQVSMSS